MADLRVRCPSCDSVLKAPATAAGKKIRCPKCKDPIQLPATSKRGEPKQDRANPEAQRRKKQREDLDEVEELDEIEDSPRSKRRRPRPKPDEVDEMDELEEPEPTPGRQRKKGRHSDPEEDRDEGEEGRRPRNKQSRRKGKKGSRSKRSIPLWGWIAGGGVVVGAAVIAVLVLTGAFDDNSPNGNGGPAGNNPSLPTREKAAEAIQAFAQALQNEDYDRVLGLTYAHPNDKGRDDRIAQWKQFRARGFISPQSAAVLTQQGKFGTFTEMYSHNPGLAQSAADRQKALLSRCYVMVRGREERVELLWTGDKTFLVMTVSDLSGLTSGAPPGPGVP